MPRSFFWPGSHGLATLVSRDGPSRPIFRLKTGSWPVLSLAEQIFFADGTLRTDGLVALVTGKLSANWSRLLRLVGWRTGFALTVASLPRPVLFLSFSFLSVALQTL